ncbi:Mobile element protein [Richelia intracellularis]|nr:Mobile element protein [Richelia intracellularis]
MNSPALLALNKSCQVKTERQINSHIYVSNHQQCNHECGCKNVLNNLRLIVQLL